jgi:hypothetical protein
LVGCTSREFLLPVWDEAEEAKRHKALLLETTSERLKVYGLDAFRDEPMSPADGAKTLKFLECAVVPEMPTLWLRSTSLTHGALMLYDGESFVTSLVSGWACAHSRPRSTIRLGVENTSSCPIDFVKLSFTDSYTESTQQYLEEGEISSSEAYELESDIIRRPVFSWSGESALAIPPGSSAIIEVSCLGKVGW